MSQVRRFVVAGLDTVAGRRARRGLRIAALDDTGQQKAGTATAGVWALVGGAQTEGLVRVGSTTRRPAHHRSAYVDALLQHLVDVGFDGATRPLGYDERGRQVLTFIDGEVPPAVPYRLGDAQLRSAAV